MKSTLALTPDDIDLLFSVPQPGGEVADILRAYVYFHHKAPPSYVDFVSCVNKAINIDAGYIIGNRIHITDKWYKDLHPSTSDYDEFDLLSDLKSSLSKMQWSVDSDYKSIGMLDEAEYAVIAKSANFGM